MTITPIAGTDDINWLDGGGVRQSSIVVVAVNPDGTSMAGSNTAPVTTRDAALSTNDLTAAVINISTATTTAIVSATASQTTRVHRVRLNVAGAQQITVQSASTTREVLNFTASGMLVYDFDSRPWYTTATNEALNFVTTTTAQVNGVVEYIKSA